MINSRSNEEGVHICLACLGSMDLYDGETDTYCKCKYCNGTGEASKADNERFLDTIINYN